jgi:hypothetical protein
MTDEYVWFVPKVGDWVITKTKRIGVIGWVDKSIQGNMYLYFPEGNPRSYRLESLTVLERPMQKLLTSVNEEFYKNIFKRGY